MFIVQTRHAKGARTYSILMAIVLLMLGAAGGFGGLLTARWDVLPKKK
jgi:hypothetical protein